MANGINRIADSLKSRIENDPKGLYRTQIELNDRPQSLSYPAASRLVRKKIKELLSSSLRTEQAILSQGDDDHPYVIARLQGNTIQQLVLDSEVGPLISTVQPKTDDQQYFNPDNLIQTVISVPMLARIAEDPSLVQDVQIEVNVKCEDGQAKATQRVKDLIGDAIAHSSNQTLVQPGDVPQGVNEWKSQLSDQYVYASLSGYAIRELVKLDNQWDQRVKSDAPDEKKKKDWHTIYHVWPDFKLRAQVWRSAATVKADASRRSFATTGKGVVWAILDSGIDGNHFHFRKYANLELPSGLTHMDFTQLQPVSLLPAQLTDDYGHGTHVAGVIGGELDDTLYRAISLSRERDQDGKITFRGDIIDAPIIGVAPQCKLLSYKVLDKDGEGSVSTVIAAIRFIQQLNGYGRNLVIHGVNMSLGYDFDPEWFACGQSPICVEVNRLVSSGVAVVVAAGNTGKGFALTINDPGNAELAVTVGATHRDMPHRYGVSYFSSKGPTADGRAKPDLLAPGERIISCGAGPDVLTYQQLSTPVPPDTKVPQRLDAYYLERSGTSMAAPHVSGIIAGILSTRGEFIGLPEDIKEYLVKNATDLGREKAFQGGGLVDMMRTIQAM
jgi:subtilisin family serine protease